MLKARHFALAFSDKGSKQLPFWILEILAGDSVETFTNRRIFCCWILYPEGRSRYASKTQQDDARRGHCMWSLEGSDTPGLICSDTQALAPCRRVAMSDAFLPASNTSTFQYHFQRYLGQEWAFIRQGRHREPDASECLRKFDGVIGYTVASRCGVPGNNSSRTAANCVAGTSSSVLPYGKVEPGAWTPLQ